MKLGEIIYNYRMEHGMSMSEFGRKVGFTNSYVCMLEKGVNSNGKPIHPTLDAIQKICVGLSLPTQEVIAMILDEDEKELKSNEVLDATEDMTESEIKELLNYANYLKSKRKSNKIIDITETA